MPQESDVDQIHDEIYAEVTAFLSTPHYWKAMEFVEYILYKYGEVNWMAFESRCRQFHLSPNYVKKTLDILIKSKPPRVQKKRIKKLPPESIYFLVNPDPEVQRLHKFEEDMIKLARNGDVNGKDLADIVISHFFDAYLALLKEALKYPKRYTFEKYGSFFTV